MTSSHQGPYVISNLGANLWTSNPIERRPNTVENTTTVLYRFKTVRTDLAIWRSRFETFVMIEVTAFFKP